MKISSTYRRSCCEERTLMEFSIPKKGVTREGSTQISSLEDYFSQRKIFLRLRIFLKDRIGTIEDIQIYRKEEEGLKNFIPS